MVKAAKATAKAASPATGRSSALRSAPPKMFTMELVEIMTPCR